MDRGEGERCVFIFSANFPKKTAQDQRMHPGGRFLNDSGGRLQLVHLPSQSPAQKQAVSIGEDRAPSGLSVRVSGFISSSLSCALGSHWVALAFPFGDPGQFLRLLPLLTLGPS